MILPPELTEFTRLTKPKAEENGDKQMSGIGGADRRTSNFGVVGVEVIVVDV